MVSKAQFEKIALSFDGTELRPHFGQPSVMAFGKFLTRLRAEDDLIVIRMGSIDERDLLLEMDAETFTLTDHYRNYPAILARRGKMDAKRLRHMLEQHWRRVAPKKLLKTMESSAPAGVRTNSTAGRRKKAPVRVSGRKRKA